MTFKIKRKLKTKGPKLNRAEREQADKAARTLRTFTAKLRALVDRTRIEWTGEPNRSEFGIALDPGLIRFFFSVMAEAGARKEVARAEAATLDAAAAVSAALPPEGQGEPPSPPAGDAETEAFKKFLSGNAAADNVSREGSETQSPGPEPCPLGDGNPGPSGGNLGPEPGGG